MVVDIGPDVWNIIMKYKQQLEDLDFIKETDEKLKKTHNNILKKCVEITQTISAPNCIEKLKLLEEERYLLYGEYKELQLNQHIAYKRRHESNISLYDWVIMKYKIS